MGTAIVFHGNTFLNVGVHRTHLMKVLLEGTCIAPFQDIGPRDIEILLMEDMTITTQQQEQWYNDGIGFLVVQWLIVGHLTFGATHFNAENSGTLRTTEIVCNMHTGHLQETTIGVLVEDVGRMLQSIAYRFAGDFDHIEGIREWQNGQNIRSND